MFHLFKGIQTFLSYLFNKLHRHFYYLSEDEIVVTTSKDFNMTYYCKYANNFSLTLNSGWVTSTELLPNMTV